MKIKFSSLTLVLLLSLPVLVKAQTIIKLRSATDNREFVLSKEKGKFVALHFLLKQNAPIVFATPRNISVKQKH